MALVADFTINIDKRDVWKILEEYEERNTRMAFDINTSEFDLLKVTGSVTATDEVAQKIDRVNETIEKLRKRKADCDQRNEFFSAPKRAAQKKKEQQQ